MLFCWFFWQVHRVEGLLQLVSAMVEQVTLSQLSLRCRVPSPIAASWVSSPLVTIRALAVEEGAHTSFTMTPLCWWAEGEEGHPLPPPIKAWMLFQHRMGAQVVEGQPVAQGVLAGLSCHLQGPMVVVVAAAGLVTDKHINSSQENLAKTPLVRAVADKLRSMVRMVARVTIRVGEASGEAAATEIMAAEEAEATQASQLSY